MRDIEELAEGMIAVAGAPLDATSGIRAGTRYGPAAIREASLQLAYYFQTSSTGGLYDVRTKQQFEPRDLSQIVADVGDFNIFPLDIQRTTESIRAGVAAIVRRGALPVMLGGDHYVTYPAFLGFADAMAERGARRLGFIQLDAHLDLSDDSPIFGTHYHGSNSRRISEHPMVQPENMVWIGISGYARTDQWAFVQEHGSHVYTVDDVRERGAVDVAREALKFASDGCDAIYLTIDMDSVGAAYAPGTHSPTLIGLTPEQLLSMVDVLSGGPVGGFDFVEVSPGFDPSGATQRLATVAILDFLRPRLIAGPNR
jgi:agmatinase